MTLGSELLQDHPELAVVLKLLDLGQSMRLVERSGDDTGNANSLAPRVSVATFAVSDELAIAKLFALNCGS